MSIMNSSCTDLLPDVLTFAGRTGNLCVKPHFDGSKSSGPADRQSFVTLPTGRVTAFHNEWFRYQPLAVTLAQSAAIQSP
jgi:hypothetical protein